MIIIFLIFTRLFNNPVLIKHIGVPILQLVVHYSAYPKTEFEPQNYCVYIACFPSAAYSCISDVTNVKAKQRIHSLNLRKIINLYYHQTSCHLNPHLHYHCLSCSLLVGWGYSTAGSFQSLLFNNCTAFSFIRYKQSNLNIYCCPIHK